MRIRSGMTTGDPPSPRRRRRGVRRALIAAAAALALPLTLTSALSGSAQANEADCSVDYSVNDWGSGFTADLTLHNEGSSPIDGWTVSYEYAGNQQLSQGWNADWSQSGRTVSLSNLAWNAVIPAGASVSAGANFTYSGSNAAPGTFSVNGTVCGEDSQPVTPTVVASPTSLGVAPGSTGTFRVSLSSQPESTVSVGVSRTSGNSALTVSDGSSLSFTPANWDTPQQVTVSAAAEGSGSAVFTAAAPGHEAATVTVTQLAGADSEYEERFLELYHQVMDPANGYFSPEGIPYHAVETLNVEAPDHGHETTSEAYSYLIWMEAMYGKVTQDWGPFNDSWELMEQYMIPGSADQPTNSFYDPSSPATYAAEYPTDSSYPSALNSDVPVGQDPLAAELSSTYGTDEIYGMHWLQDVDNVYGFGNSPGAPCAGGPETEGPSFINTFQRGSQESVWRTVPHPSCEDFTWGGENGFLDLYVEDEGYAEQWRYTAAPDADARAVQAAFWANRWATEQGNHGEIAGTLAKAAQMGDYLRYAMFDKYFKQIGDCTSPTGCAAGTGRDSAHYLLSWYYAWGGAMDPEAGWAWRIGGSHSHFGYQNPMTAHALLTDPDLAPASPTAAADWENSLQRQLELYQWLQSADGGIAGGVTNSYEGAYGNPPAGTATFYGMTYDEAPVYRDPPSNEWFGMQAWSMQRLAEYYYETGDSTVGDVLDKWAAWAMSEVTIGTDGDYQIPATLSWSGQPDNWNPSNPGSNSGLRVTVTDHSQDAGVAGSLANTLAFYAAASGNEEAKDMAAGLLDAMWHHRDDIGIAVPETRGDYSRFNEEIYIPAGWSGTMPNGDVIEPGATFDSIRSFYHDDPDWDKVQAHLDGGPAPTFEYHRFWAQADIAMALGTYADLFGE
ncbi:glycoside hydrolase family 48 protein [Streptomyces sp. ACA25]|uniref:glycoside hydrolase family 48 protein n=1 Tax=Streptomyces sp. ACA25 TaxID=3022596 RepID=UPI0023070FC2|nr:glycoside hydrolase family 48 protein [Streptomyces sp. ACA25]MDB1087523.1 glycoside hydrolase family 48 protein [Streptomyces sp. ACA25]